MDISSSQFCPKLLLHCDVSNAVNVRSVYHTLWAFQILLLFLDPQFLDHQVLLNLFGGVYYDTKHNLNSQKHHIPRSHGVTLRFNCMLAFVIILPITIHFATVCDNTSRTVVNPMTWLWCISVSGSYRLRFCQTLLPRDDLDSLVGFVCVLSADGNKYRSGLAGSFAFTRQGCHYWVTLIRGKWQWMRRSFKIWISSLISGSKIWQIKVNFSTSFPDLISISNVTEPLAEKYHHCVRLWVVILSILSKFGANEWRDCDEIKIS